MRLTSTWGKLCFVGNNLTTNIRYRLQYFIALLFLLILACGNFSGENNSLEEVNLDSVGANEIVSKSIERMRNIIGFHFIIDRSGAPEFIDPDETISFSRAEGIYVTPNKVTATIRVILPGLVTEVDVISIGDIQWQTNYLSGVWELLAPEYSFNPSILFDPETGIQAALANDLLDLEFVGLEEIEEMPGFPLYLFEAVITGERTYTMTYGMIGPDEMSVQLWIAPDSFELYRLIIVESGVDGAEDTNWQLDFWDFDQVIEIVPPVP